MDEAKVKNAQKAFEDFVSDPRNINEAVGQVVSALIDAFLAEVHRMLAAMFPRKHPDLYGILLSSQLDALKEQFNGGDSDFKNGVGGIPEAG